MSLILVACTGRLITFGVAVGLLWKLWPRLACSCIPVNT